MVKSLLGFDFIRSFAQRLLGAIGIHTKSFAYIFNARCLFTQFPWVFEAAITRIFICIIRVRLLCLRALVVHSLVPTSPIRRNILNYPKCRSNLWSSPEAGFVRPDFHLLF